MQNDVNIATVRTSLPVAWATLISYLAARFGLSISNEDMTVLVAVLPILIPVFYRIFREVESRYPRIGRVIFGTSVTPHYDQSGSGK